MKILIITNRLYPFGGAEMYAYVVGEELKKLGHNVQYFGINYDYDSFKNDYGLYAKKSRTSCSIIKNRYNCKKLENLLKDFKPDLVHLHLIYFTLTPAIVYTIKKFNIPIVQTIHDSKWICPNYQLFLPSKQIACFRCIDGHFFRCVRNKCFKNSFFLSYMSYLESNYYKKRNITSLIDLFIFPSDFMRDLHEKYGFNKNKCITLCNFSRLESNRIADKNKIRDSNKYVLYFGRLSKEKGMENLIKICKDLTGIRFVIAGEGEYSSLFKKISNCDVVGFKNGEELSNLIANSVCTIYPSIWYENCPLSVIESICLGTPVVASNIGGIPSLINNGKDGFLVDSKDIKGFEQKITYLFLNDDVRQSMRMCALKHSDVFSKKTHVNKIIHLYHEVIYGKQSAH